MTFEPEGRTIAYDAAWLSLHSYDRDQKRSPGWTAPEIETWDSGLGRRVPLADFSAVSRSRRALGEWLGRKMIRLS